VRGWERIGLALTLLVVSGCYTYRPVRPGEALLDSRVRATVSPQEAAELATVLRGVRSAVVGRLVENSDERIMLEVPLFSQTAGMSRNAVHNRVAIPLSELVTLESRSLSTWRTGLVVSAVAVAVGGAWVVVSGEGSRDDKEKPGTNNAVISVFRIPFALFH
jgi:hypothetical protein